MASPTANVTIPPFFEYMLFGTMGLLCLAITIGIVILMRRHATRDQMTGVGEIDYPKIAAQLQKEILRLQALRDRIYPEGAADLAISEANRSAPTVVGSAEQGASLASMSADDLSELPEVQNLLSEQIAKLNKQHEEALAKVTASGGGSGGESAEASAAKDAKITSLQIEVDSLKAKAAAVSLDGAGSAALEQEVKGLKDKLQEYEIFEEDLSRVKELSRENEELKKQLAGKGSGGAVAAAAAPVTVASTGAMRTASPAVATQELNEADFEAAVESDSPALFNAPEESEETSVGQVTAEFEKLLAGGDAAAPGADATKASEVPKGFESESVASGPDVASAAAPSASEDTVPVSEDDLMAEFEKLLGSVDGKT